MDYTVEYLVEQNPEQTDSAFYCWTNGWEGQFFYGEEN